MLSGLTAKTTRLSCRSDWIELGLVERARRPKELIVLGIHDTEDAYSTTAFRNPNYTSCTAINDVSAGTSGPVVNIYPVDVSDVAPFLDT